MKNKVYGVVFGMVMIVLIGLFISCGSTPSASNPYRPLSGFPNANVIGIIQTNFESAFGIDTPGRISDAAYIALLEAAKHEYNGNIDIADITWVFTKRDGIKYRFFYSANGKVVLLGRGNNRSTATGVEGALERAANDVSKDFNNNARIAIVQISAPDRSTRDYMIGELEYILQKQGYYMVDRAQLDKIFEEQRFGATSDVDDNTAARMGKISGASIVITGKVDGEGNLRRLRLRALNTETARVVGVASEKL